MRSSYARYLGFWNWGMLSASGVALIVIAVAGTPISVGERGEFAALGVAGTIGGVAGLRRILRCCLKVEPTALTVVALFKTTVIERSQVVGVRVVMQSGYRLALELSSGKRVGVHALDYPTRRRAEVARRMLCETLDLGT